MTSDPLTVFIAGDSQPVAEMLTELIRVPGRIEVVGVGATEEATMQSIRAHRRRKARLTTAGEKRSEA